MGRSIEPCMCGDSQCPVCGSLQGTLEPKKDDPNICWYCHKPLRYPGTRCPSCGESNEPDPPKKPRVRLSGENGNIFNILGIATTALRKAGLRNEALKLRSDVLDASSYEEAMKFILQVVEVE